MKHITTAYAVHRTETKDPNGFAWNADQAVDVTESATTYLTGSYKADCDGGLQKNISRDDVTRLFAPSDGKLIYRQKAAVIRTREKKNFRGSRFVVPINTRVWLLLFENVMSGT